MDIFLSIAVTTCVLMASVAQAADAGTRQLQRPPMQQQRGSVQQLQLTPEYLNQQILILTHQVKALQTQVNGLRSVVQLTPNGATIQAEHLTVNTGKTLTMSSGMGTSLTSGDNLSLSSQKDVLVKGASTATVEGGGTVNVRSPQIKLNNGTKPIALKDCPVAEGKVIAGSATVFTIKEEYGFTIRTKLC